MSKKKKKMTKLEHTNIYNSYYTVGILNLFLYRKRGLKPQTKNYYTITRMFLGIQAPNMS